MRKSFAAVFLLCVCLSGSPASAGLLNSDGSPGAWLIQYGQKGPELKLEMSSMAQCVRALIDLSRNRVFRSGHQDGSFNLVIDSTRLELYGWDWVTVKDKGFEADPSKKSGEDKYELDFSSTAYPVLRRNEKNYEVIMSKVKGAHHIVFEGWSWDTECIRAK